MGSGEVTKVTSSRGGQVISPVCSSGVKGRRSFRRTEEVVSGEFFPNVGRNSQGVRGDSVPVQRGGDGGLTLGTFLPGPIGGRNWGCLTLEGSRLGLEGGGHRGRGTRGEGTEPCRFADPNVPEVCLPVHV